MTNVYQIVVRGDLFGNKEHFECKTYKFEAKDTGKSYLFDNKRIAKDKLNICKEGHDSTLAIGFTAYTLEEKIEETKEMLLKKVRTHAKIRLEQMQRLEKLLQTIPVEKFRDETL